MIIDHIKNAENYYNMGDKLASALRWLKDNDATAMDTGKYPIQGEQIYAMVQRYKPRDRSKRQWEAHQEFFDVQYVASGIEDFGYCHIDKLKVATPYDAKIDAVMLDGEGNFMSATSGPFLILAPQDAHMPGIEPLIGKTCDEVVKVVIKVAVN